MGKKKSLAEKVMRRIEKETGSLGKVSFMPDHVTKMMLVDLNNAIYDIYKMCEKAEPKSTGNLYQN